jgi:hypothetical protein
VSHCRRDTAVSELSELVQNLNRESLREQVNWVMNSVDAKTEFRAIEVVFLRFTCELECICDLLIQN